MDVNPPFRSEGVPVPTVFNDSILEAAAVDEDAVLEVDRYGRRSIIHPFRFSNMTPNPFPPSSLSGSDLSSK